MRYDLPLRRAFRERAERVAHEMSAWEARPRIGKAEADRIAASITPFPHTTRVEPIRLAGVDGTGEFPALTYSDSFVYCTLAQATLYESVPGPGLREVPPALGPVFELTWLPENSAQAPPLLDAALESLAGEPIRDVIATSDYRHLKDAQTGRPSTIDSLQAALIRPHASDSGNVGIQLRSTAELGAALKVLRSPEPVDIVLLDGTLSLPFVGRHDASLFHEHLRRLCCVVARDRSTALLAISKSHGLPSIEAIEERARLKLALPAGAPAEHWFLRIPVREEDGWALSLAEGRTLPPVGAVSYLARFHRSTPVLRIDLDATYWRDHLRGATPAETLAREVELFSRLDYASHDQRCYGYPYPLKAGHDRASLTQAERTAIRKQLIDAAVRAGMKPGLFRNASMATGHE